MTLKELMQKDVIRLENGRNLGRIDDLEFDEQTSCILRYVLFGRPRLFGLLGREPDIYIERDEVLCLGEDTVLVDCGREPQQCRPSGPKK